MREYLKNENIRHHCTDTSGTSADISDIPMSKNALLQAERNIKVFARYPDQEDDADESGGGDPYTGAIKVGTPAARKAAASKRSRVTRPGPEGAAETRA
jgi:hypothetical protein